jgi:hypothetical protein
MTALYQRRCIDTLCFHKRYSRSATHVVCLVSTLYRVHHSLWCGTPMRVSIIENILRIVRLQYLLRRDKYFFITGNVKVDFKVIVV